MEIGDLEITVTGGNQLSIKGERNPPNIEQGVWHRQERGYGKFSRLLTLPCEVKTDQVEAEFKDGVLTIKLPKSEAAKPKPAGHQGGLAHGARSCGNQQQRRKTMAKNLAKRQGEQNVAVAERAQRHDLHAALRHRGNR